MKFCCLSVRRIWRVKNDVTYFSFFFFFLLFLLPLLLYYYVPLLLLQSKSIKNQTCSNMFRFVKNSEKNSEKSIWISWKTNPGKVISKGMIDISGHPNIAAAGGGKTRIYKSAGKELSNRFSKGSFKVPALHWLLSKGEFLTCLLFYIKS